MAEQVLSQEEIDALLNALDTGEIDPDDVPEKEEDVQKIKEYDFKRPNRFSKEYIDTLHMVFEAYAKMNSNLLSNQLSSSVQVNLLVVEQVSYDEFIKSIPNPTLIAIFHMEPLGGSMFLEINPTFGKMAIELMCGGGKGIEGIKNRLTDIEVEILQEVIYSLLGNLRSAWGDLITVEPLLDNVETNPQLVQSLSPNEPVALISFSIEALNNKTYMNLCIPYIAFENHTEILSIKNWFDLEKKEDALGYTDIISNKLQSTELELSVILGKTYLTIHQILNLENGDVLELDKKTDDLLTMNVEEKERFKVQPGIKSRKMAVQVVELIEEDD
jgi:flagellar motor switch protein FliM